MVFLNPAMLLGLLAASIPILIHLLNLRKLKKIEFSTLSFLKELEKTKVKKIKLKQWILLLLRVLIILFLVAAFARPTIDNLSLGSVNSVAKTSAVIILDNTISMSLVNENGSYLNQVKQKAKDLLDQFHEGDEITILIVGEEEKLTSSSIDLLNKFIDDVELSYLKNDVNKSLQIANDVLNESKDFNKEIYLLTDYQKKTVENPNLNSNYKVYAIDLFQNDKKNLSINDLKVNNQIFEKGKSINFSATVKNYSSNNINNTYITLFINGNRSSQQSFSIGSGENKIVNFETTLQSIGLLEVMVEIEDDDLLADNKRFLSLFVPEDINIATFYENINDTKFLDIAIKGNESTSLNNTIYKTNRIGSVDLNNYDVVFLITGKDVVNNNRLVNYINDGGSLFIIPSSSSTLININASLRNLGLPIFNSTIGTFGNLENPILINKSDFEHPVLQNLFEKGKTNKIDSPNFYHFYVYKNNIGKRIFELEDNSLMLSEYKIGKGKVFLSNSAFNLGWNNLPIKGMFSPIINKSIFYLSSKQKESNNKLVGEEIAIDIKKLKLPQISVKNPNNQEELINLDSLNNINYYNYKNVVSPGIYKFYSNNSLLDYYSINIDNSESDLQKYTEEEFEELLKESNFSGEIFWINENDNYSEIIKQARFGIELWRYFLIVALILALIEMYISRSSKKDLAAIN